MAELLVDNFESYSTGELAGQGGWTALTTSGFFNVSTGNPNSGSKSATNNGSVANKMYYKAATNTEQAGTATFFLSFTACPGGAGSLGMGAYFFSGTPTGTDPSQGGAAPWEFRVYAISTSTTLWKISYSARGGASGDIVTGLSIASTQYKVVVTFDGSGTVTNVTVNGANSTNITTGTWTNLTVVGIVTSNNGATDVAYVDDFGGVVTPTTTTVVNNFLLMGV